MSPVSLATLSNPLATPSFLTSIELGGERGRRLGHVQLSTSPSQLDGVPSDLEVSVRYAGAKLTQAAGILLRLPQDIIAQAMVIYLRFWVGSEGGSMMVHGAKDVSAASLYLMAKLSAHPQSPRSVLNVYAYLLSSASLFINPTATISEPNPDLYYLSEGDYHNQRNMLLKTESQILRTLGFQTHVLLPYTLSINYLQALVPSSHSSFQALARRVFQQLNTALLSPQLLYLTHQPPALAVAAIYLAARETGVKLPEVEWWEVFDVEREELGFLVLALQSTYEWAKEEARKWGKKKIPMTAEKVESECERMKMLESGQ